MAKKKTENVRDLVAVITVSKKALKQLVDQAEQELDRGDDWDELSDALDEFAPYVYPDWEIRKWHS